MGTGIIATERLQLYLDPPLAITHKVGTGIIATERLQHAASREPGDPPSVGTGIIATERLQRDEQQTERRRFLKWEQGLSRPSDYNIVKRRKKTEQAAWEQGLSRPSDYNTLFSEM